MNSIQFQIKVIFIWLIQCNHKGQETSATGISITLYDVGMEALQKVMSEKLSPEPLMARLKAVLVANP